LGGLARAAYGAPKMSNDFIPGVSDQDLDLTPEGWVNKRTGTNYGMSKPNIEQPMQDASFGRRLFSPDTAAIMQQANQRYMMNPIESEQKTSIARDFTGQQLAGMKSNNPDVARAAAILLSGGQNVPEHGAGNFNVPIQQGEELRLGVPDTLAATTANVATAKNMQVNAALKALQDYGMGALTETQLNILKAEGIISDTGIINAKAGSAKANVDLMASQGDELANRLAGGSEFYKNLTADRLKALRDTTSLGAIQAAGGLDRGPTIEAAAMANAQVAKIKAIADQAAAEKFGINGFQLAQYNNYRQLGYDAEAAAEKARISKDIIPDVEKHIKAQASITSQTSENQLNDLPLSLRTDTATRLLGLSNALHPAAPANPYQRIINTEKRSISPTRANPNYKLPVPTNASTGADSGLSVPGLGVINPVESYAPKVAVPAKANSPATNSVQAGLSIRPPVGTGDVAGTHESKTEEPEEPEEPEVTRPPLTTTQQLAMLGAAAGLQPKTTKMLVRAAKAGKNINGLLQNIFENVKRNTQQ
jgi:hypothetical protein